MALEGAGATCYTAAAMNYPPHLSVIIPLLNEAEGLPELYRELRQALRPWADSHELIFVDDGSTDGSFAALEKLHAEDPRVVVLRFRRNQGKATALMAGFGRARGEILVTLDADLQDDPREIPRFLEKLEEGFDLVSGWKVERQDPIIRLVLSRGFNRVTALLTGVALHDFNCGFKCYRRDVIQEIRLHGELHRFIPALASWRGFRIAEIEVAHRARKYGQSKYGSERIPRGFFDLLTVLMLTRYHLRPLHLFGTLGFLLSLAGSTVLAYLIVGWFFGQWIGDRPLLSLSILTMITGLQFVFFGLLAEIIVYSSRQTDIPPVAAVLDQGDSSPPTPVA
ncbi:MAG TPA: glycosyltransferase family 2 protein [Verrucomicrobiae bacterium]|nr:glycosyltransferase family 2 protein [Verrucomicrobiae bacterium]